MYLTHNPGSLWHMLICKDDLSASFCCHVKPCIMDLVSVYHSETLCQNILFLAQVLSHGILWQQQKNGCSSKKIKFSLWKLWNLSLERLCLYNVDEKNNILDEGRANNLIQLLFYRKTTWSENKFLFLSWLDIFENKQFGHLIIILSNKYILMSDRSIHSIFNLKEVS